MDVRYRYTKHQVARGARPDAERHDAIFLFKNVSSLRLTYQISVLSVQALESQRRLIIRVPKNCDIDQALQQFRKENSTTVRIEKV